MAGKRVEVLITLTTESLQILNCIKEINLSKTI